MAKMGTVWDRTAEFLSDNLGAILPVALLAFFVPASIEGSFQAAKTGGSPELVLSLYLVQLAFGILSLWGSLTISAMALDMASARSAGVIGRDRLLPALAVSVLLFAVMFLPTEGLYAEAIRRPGLVDVLQREHRVVIAGPTTVTALLNSLQMGFRTLAIEQRSSEVWSLLGAVKGEFGKFAGILEKAEKQINTVGKSLGDASRKTRTIERKLRGVESLSADASQALLGELGGDDEGEEQGTGSGDA